MVFVAEETYYYKRKFENLLLWKVGLLSSRVHTSSCLSVIYYDQFSRAQSTFTLKTRSRNERQLCAAETTVLRSAKRAPANARRLNNRKWRQSYCSVGERSRALALLNAALVWSFRSWNLYSKRFSSRGFLILETENILQSKF